MNRYSPKINENICQHSLIHEIHINFIHKSAKLETTQWSINKWGSKQTGMAIEWNIAQKGTEHGRISKLLHASKKPIEEDYVLCDFIYLEF